jgi:hypothetical protein
MQLRCVSRFFHAQDARLVAPAHLIPPAPLAVKRSTTVSSAILDLMAHKGLCDLIYSLGGGSRLMAVYPYGPDWMLTLQFPSFFMVYKNMGWCDYSGVQTTLSEFLPRLITKSDHIKWNNSVDDQYRFYL